ncbi:cysteine protease atg4-like protein [Phanerochaete sordida]|uniref:Cysteine protease n=1 Tax=Phanerochaete sordida TaxID=48140 RepID=A0A9P3LCU7_9APHY|nr:cysteine protease atg4-like protein [Phanerochaete sordida]
MSSSNKTSKHSPSASSPPSTPHSSKLPKFLQKQRDRSKSVVESSHSAGSSSSSISELSRTQTNTRSSIIRKSSRKSGPASPRDSVDRRQDTPPSDSPDVEQVDAEARPSQDGGEETPVIVEPVAIPRTRSRSDRPLSENYPAAYYPSSSGTRLTDLPSRLSGWFSHTFSTSTTDLSLPQLLQQQHVAAGAGAGSPKGKGSALLTAAKHGKGHLDKAMRYLLDSDAVPDKCGDSIWLLGVEHPGYDPSSSPAPSVGRRSSVESRHPPSARNSLSSSPTSAMLGADPSLSQSQPASSKDPGRHWPPVFYSDFTSRIWLTYRSQFLPIRDISLDELNMGPPESAALSASPQPKKWNWPLGGEKCWSSDAGWGCMLRTGQSLLANALIHVHLGRDWRKPPHPVYTSDYATYVQIITWFLDDPSPLCPFSVHRMALVGKQLGVKVGQWFGPSTAAGAIKTLVHAFPEAGLGIHVAADGGTIYESEVFAASHSGIGSPRRHTRRVWGDRAVLILIGHRLGIDGVNPIYYDTLKTLYTWPQSVGIAGGRPSSSYYFVGSQADNLFYLDPHHARPAIPLRPPPPAEQPSPIISPTASRHSSTSPEPQSPSDHGSPRSPTKHIRAPTSPISIRSGSSFSRVTAPSPLQHQISTSSSTTAASYVTTTSHTHSSGSHARWRTSSAVEGDSEMDSRELGIETEDLDPLQRHYCLAYSATELKTFHCDRVRKMPLSGLDPSMLIGFLVKDEAEWQDLKSRITELNSRSKAPVLHLQDEPPNWNSDSEMGLESISEPDFDLPDEDDEFADAEDRMREGSASPDTSVPSTSSKSPEEDDTEDDPVDPITPGPGRVAFSDVRAPGHLEKQASTSTTGSSHADSLSFDDEDDEEWESPDFGSHAGHSAPATLREPPELLDSQATITRETSESASSDPGRVHRKKAKKKHAKSKPEQYPFPAATHDGGEELFAPPSDRRIPQMRTQKARDGGRTQSGGVRGIPADDLDDS